MSRTFVPLSFFTLALALAGSGTPGVAVAAGTSAVCTVTADTLAGARRAYADSCTVVRVDCDPVDGRWMCSSERIGRFASGSTAAVVPSGTPSEPTPAVPVPAPSPSVPAPSSATRQGGVCAASASELGQAKARYAERCSAPRVDCDAVGGEWTCASYRIGLSAPGSNENGVSVVAEGAGPSAPEPSAATPSTPAPSASSGSLRAEAESGTLSFGWDSEGDYIIWRGTPDRYALASRRDDANIAYTLEVPRAGRYRFTMRSAALEGSNPAEPPNDVWVSFGSLTWIKAYMNRDGNFHIGARGERGGRHAESLLESELSAGSVTVTISGRSTGHAIDWIGLDEVGGASASPAATGPYRDGDLLSLHHDSYADADDLQAMVANRLVLDAAGAIDKVMVHGTISHRFSRTLTGSENLARELFGDDLVVAKPQSTWGTDKYDANAVAKIATLWQATLAGSGAVHVAEGGTSDFTALVLEELVRRGVGGLERVRIVQHSHGAGFNESQTRSDRIATVKRLATWVAIDNGNDPNGTPDFNQRSADIEARARRSKYAKQWNYALDAIRAERRMDFSDTVELFEILGIPKSFAPDVATFADRYIK